MGLVSQRGSSSPKAHWPKLTAPENVIGSSLQRPARPRRDRADRPNHSNDITTTSWPSTYAPWLHYDQASRYHHVSSDHKPQRAPPGGYCSPSRLDGANPDRTATRKPKPSSSPSAATPRMSSGACSLLSLLPRKQTRPHKRSPQAKTRHPGPCSLHTHSISPTLPARAVLVRTLAAPINPADINTIQGTYGSPPAFTSLIGTAAPSAVPGNEGCAEVVAVGEGVKTLQRGDWVVPMRSGAGTWRTHALVEEADAALLRVEPEGLTPAQVATVSVNPSSAFRLLRDFVDLLGLSVRTYAAGGAGGGAWFVQNGANSAVGRAAIQLGRLWGLRSINVVRRRESDADTDALKAELRDLGATLVVTEDEFQGRGFADRLRDECTRGGREPLMLGLNCVGGRSALALAKCLDPGATLVTYGAMSRQPVSLPTGLLIFKDLTFKGFWLSRVNERDRDGKRKTIEELLDLMRTGKFKTGPVDEVPWNWETKEDELKAAVSGTLGGFRKGKGLFVFGET